MEYNLRDLKEFESKLLEQNNSNAIKKPNRKTVINGPNPVSVVHHSNGRLTSHLVPLEE